MLKSYLLIALRQFRKNRGAALINSIGLSTGMAVALVIFHAARGVIVGCHFGS